MTHPSLLVVGEALIDTVVHPIGRRVQHPGGSPANVAITLGRLGHTPTLLTRIGSDSSGNLIRKWLRASRVTLDGRSLRSAATSEAIAFLDDSGAARYELNILWDLPDVDTEAVDLLHIGSISATLAPGAEAIDRLVDRVRGQAVISYDPNVRPSLIKDPQETRKKIEGLVARADIVKVSDEDLEWIDPTSSPEDVARRWLGTHPEVVVITRGSRGVTAISGQSEVSVDAPNVDVVDTVGAGDTLMGAFIAGVVELGLLDRPDARSRRGWLAALTPSDLTCLLRYGAAAAAVTVSRAGANPPQRSELPAIREPLHADNI